jgi:hypothetical protein
MSNSTALAGRPALTERPDVFWAASGVDGGAAAASAPALQVDPVVRRIAVWAQALYLGNLLLLPGVAFVALLALGWRHRHDASPWVRQHLRVTVVASAVAGVLILGVCLAVLGLGGWQGPWTWVVLLTYLVCVHAALVLLGVYGLAKAMAGQPVRSLAEAAR